MSLPAPTAWPAVDPVDYPTGDLLRERATATPDATAVVDTESGERWTYDALDRRVSARLAGIEGVTNAVDGRLGLMLGTGVLFVELYFASERAGGTVVPLNVRLDTDTLATQARRGELDALVCDTATEDDATDVAPDGVPVVSVDPPNHSSIASLERVASASRDPVELSAEAERLVMFTSGTTGEPKGARLSLGNLVASATGSADRLGVEPDDRWLVCLPTYHMGGLAPVIRSTLYGTTTVIQREFEAEATAAVVDEYDVTCLSLVPTQLKRLLDHGWEPPDCVRFVLLGGAPATESLIERCERRGVPVCPTYGATETASQVATALPETAFAHPGTVGEPLRGTSVTIVGDDGNPCSAGTVGEVAVEGPTVTPGYLDENQTAEAFGDHGFATGDLGYLDAEGRLWIVGRASDVIVTGGENVQPATVEGPIRNLDGVTDVVVLGLPDDEWGERVSGLVEAPGGSVSAADVKAACRDELADFAVPKSIRVVDSLPRTASGTVDRERASELLSEA